MAANFCFGNIASPKLIKPIYNSLNKWWKKREHSGGDIHVNTCGCKEDVNIFSCTNNFLIDRDIPFTSKESGHHPLRLKKSRRVRTSKEQGNYLAIQSLKGRRWTDDELYVQRYNHKFVVNIAIPKIIIHCIPINPFIPFESLQTSLWLW